MSDLLESTIHEVEEVVPDLQEIVRVDVDDSGELMLTALCPSGTRWFTHDDRGLIERHPERDDKLPLAARLRSTSDWKVLSYRPGRRAVVLVSRGERVNVLKGHKRSRSARAAVHQGCAEGAMRRGAFRVPRLLSHDGQHEALVFEYLAAREVELGSASAALYRMLGARLAVFQTDDCARDLAVFRPADELAVLERWKAKVLHVVPALPGGWTDAHARLERRASSLPPPRLGLCHRDLHDRQVHSGGTDVAVLDFDLLCCADVALDPGNLIAHLRWRALQGLHGADEDSVRELEEAFLAGYGRDREEGFATRLAFYCASAFLRLALVYRLRPRWSGRVDELVSRASGALDDLAHAG